MNLLDDIGRIAENEQALVSQKWLEQALAEHPYCTLPLLMYLKRNGTAGHEGELARLAVMCPDRRALALQLGSDSEQFADFFPAEAPAPSPDTSTTIDRFLNNYGNTSDKELAAIEQAIFNPTPDYADVLAAQDAGSDSQAATSPEDELIAKFIAESQERERQVTSAPAQQHVEASETAEVAHDVIDSPTAHDDSMLSESLAKSYIMRHKYAKALEIIENISLKYPEKSIYFADQIRFLRVLALNEKLKQQH